MAATQAFREAVQNNDILSVRIMMKDSLLRDPSFREFSEMEAIAGHMSGLYENHDGTDLKYNPSAWNDDYMNELMVDMIYNFSHERIALLKKIIQHLHPYTKEEQEALRKHTENSDDKEIGITVGGVSGALIGYGAVKAVTASAVAAGVVGVPVGAVIGAAAGIAVAAIVKNNHQNGEK